MYKEFHTSSTPPDNDGFGCLAAIIIWLVMSLLVVLVAGCQAPRTVVVEVRDSTSTQVVTNTVVLTDTQYVTLPPQIVERTTPDTTSTLHTDFAMSTAGIHDGLLYHDLRTLQTPIPVEVQHTVTTRDSIVYREREVPKPYPVEVEVEKNLSWWQQARLHLANITLSVLSVMTAVWIVRKKSWWLGILRRTLR